MNSKSSGCFGFRYFKTPYCRTADFLKLVAIAFVIAVPVGWIVMDNWLNNFAYETNLGISVFVIAGVLALLLSVTTIS